MVVTADAAKALLAYHHYLWSFGGVGSPQCVQTCASKCVFCCAKLCTSISINPRRFIAAGAGVTKGAFSMKSQPLQAIFSLPGCFYPCTGSQLHIKAYCGIESHMLSLSCQICIEASLAQELTKAVNTTRL